MRAAPSFRAPGGPMGQAPHIAIWRPLQRLRAALADICYDAQPEDLINVSRLLTSSFALIAVYLDPTTPTMDVEESYTILIAYVLFSIGAALFLNRRPRQHLLHIATTSVDVIMLGLLAHYSEELESPYFAFFTFTLVTTAIRWGWRGVLATACALQCLLLIVGIPDLHDGGPSALNVLIMRSVFCWVTMLMLGYFGSYRARSEYRLSKLAAWPHDIITEDNRPWLSASLQHASNVLGTHRIVVIWQDHDQQTAELAWWTGEECRFAEGITLPAGILRPSEDELPTAIKDREYRDRLELLNAALPRISDNLRDLLHVDRDQAIHFATFRSIRYSGSVIVINPAFRDENIGALTKIIASRIALMLEQFSLIGELASAAGLRERMRLARDLHDSVLQDLTAAVLQLEAAVKIPPAEASDTLTRIQGLLQAQQRRLRHFVNDSRRQRPPSHGLAEQLQAFVEPLGSQWNCNMRIDVSPPDLNVTDDIATELCLALSEATANAAKHGAADTVVIAVMRQEQELLVEISNDGAPCTSYPKSTSLGRRVEEMGGVIAIADRASGFSLRMTIPMDRPRR
ncbi:sensor histidine kinase [Sphingomonas oligoaromativorans]|uniref:sensor histidine kinase n=1 Tax=Sphingomonas oligoaromativorans TaxID=575322 RepID=UPI001423F854|nr:histidine kinase [Sphingomonas oligoaromativorans]NIJ32435.1 signal transduction histidine kinase [Sphingomonas oligoaromativorans]